MKIFAQAIIDLKLVISFDPDNVTLLEAKSCSTDDIICCEVEKDFLLINHRDAFCEH